MYNIRKIKIFNKIILYQKPKSLLLYGSQNIDVKRNQSIAAKYNTNKETDSMFYWRNLMQCKKAKMLLRFWLFIVPNLALIFLLSLFLSKQRPERFFHCSA